MERPRKKSTLRAEVMASETEGGWVVVMGKDWKSKPVHRVREAVQLARHQVQRGGGGEVTVHSRNGKIVEKQTVPKRANPVYDRARPVR
jgi:Uncharacterized protein conserved in bacteria (DUF2188)